MHNQPQVETEHNSWHYLKLFQKADKIQAVLIILSLIKVQTKNHLGQLALAWAIRPVNTDKV